MLASERTKMRAKRKGVRDRARVRKRGRAEDRPAPEDVAKRTGPAEGFWAGFRVGWVRGIHGILSEGVIVTTGGLLNAFLPGKAANRGLPRPRGAFILKA